MQRGNHSGVAVFGREMECRPLAGADRAGRIFKRRGRQVMTDVDFGSETGLESGPGWTDRARAASEDSVRLAQEQRDIVQSCWKLADAMRWLCAEHAWYCSAARDNTNRLRRSRKAVADRLSAQRPVWMPTALR
jgi:hypothetical protein